MVNLNLVEDKIESMSKENLLNMASHIEDFYNRGYYKTREESINTFALSVSYIHKCPVCSNKVFLVDDKVIYGKSYGGKLYICSNYNTCGHYVGTHKGTNIPLGNLCNKETRYYRRKVHTLMDILKDRESMSSEEIHSILSSEMKLQREVTHVGMFDINQCKQAYQILSKYTIKSDDFSPIQEFDIGNIPLDFYLS